LEWLDELVLLEGNGYFLSEWLEVEVVGGIGCFEEWLEVEVVGGIGCLEEWLDEVME
jgi:hypothetical protein